MAASPRHTTPPGTRYTARSGTVTLALDETSLARLGLRFIPHGVVNDGSPDGLSTWEFTLEASSTLAVESANGVFTSIVGGMLRTRGAVLVNRPGGRTVIGNLAVVADEQGVFTVDSLIGMQADTPFRLDSIMVDFVERSQSLRLIGELVITAPWAVTLELPSAAGAIIGTMVVDAHLEADSGDVPGLTNPAEARATEQGAQSSNEAGWPDVIVADLQTAECYGSVDGITGCAIGTTACNIGTARASWISYTNQHPVIVQNAYRLMDDRFEQIGLSWVKHGFYAVAQSLCTACEDITDGSELGVGCSDPYSATLNGIQTNMSPRSTVNANTGYFPYPWDTPPPESVIDRRLQIHNSDLDPELNPGARYFVQGHYVTPGDAAARTHNNNASYREASAVRLPTGELTLSFSESADTQRGQPALRAWQDVDNSVHETDLQIPNEGLFILSSKAIALGDGVWRYEYALQNLNSDRSAMSFTVPLPDRPHVTRIGFHDVDYHSGEPYDSSDWAVSLSAGSIRWSTDGFETNENANALRWGTVYNFRFHVNAPPTLIPLTIGLFKPPEHPDDPTAISGLAWGPALAMIDCNGNGVADACDLSCPAPGCPTPCERSDDCDDNGVPDECESDCNATQMPDICDIASGASLDCNHNDVPDECEPTEDCDGNGVQDICDIAAGAAEDCNRNDVPDGCEPYTDCNGNAVQDICDIASGFSADCNGDLIPDQCEPFMDCNANFVRDICDIAAGDSTDCNGNDLPDECEPPDDCNTNGIQDICDIGAGTSEDCNSNDTPDECEPYADCNGNQLRDLCDIASGTSTDCNENATPDECEPFEDCNANGSRDICDIAHGSSADCNMDHIPDDCEISADSDSDCNADGRLDVCEIDQNSIAPGGPFFCEMNCDPDCDDNGRPDECDVLLDGDGDGLRDCEDLCPDTNPMVVCACPPLVDCCLPDWCYSDIGLPPIAAQECEQLGGVPACLVSSLCRRGCMLFDVNDDGILNMRDIAGLLMCFGIEADAAMYEECARVFDHNGDGAVDLVDYQTLVGVLADVASQRAGGAMLHITADEPGIMGYKGAR
ncbi:MAG: EF-hand domain-containing protein [Phycisphaerae bacterium]